MQRPTVFSNAVEAASRPENHHETIAYRQQRPGRQLGQPTTDRRHRSPLAGHRARPGGHLPRPGRRPAAPPDQRRTGWGRCRRRTSRRGRDAAVPGRRRHRGGRAALQLRRAVHAEGLDRPHRRGRPHLQVHREWPHRPGRRQEGHRGRGQRRRVRRHRHRLRGALPEAGVRLPGHHRCGIRPRRARGLFGAAQGRGHRGRPGQHPDAAATGGLCPGWRDGTGMLPAPVPAPRRWPRRSLRPTPSTRHRLSPC